MSIVNLCLDVEGLLGQLREDEVSPEKKEKLLVAIDAIRFIAASGQSYDFEDYRKSLDANAPPLVIAAFKTLDEADAWLKTHPRPPLGAQVLVGNEYHRVIYVRETGVRKLLPNSGALEHYLEDMTREGLPAPVAAFSSQTDAEAWLDSQPELPGHAFILIAGEYHLAVYHYRLNLRAIYPVARRAQGSAP
ncbi:head protein [Hyalangium gracile]|uniref:head protein n=1 Tax=Hyalangium gracile TaxID=394092 RepID=UPI001CCCFF57|nr:head protein [Hyalangium gracile]